MNKEKRPFGQFIAGVLVASVVCGTMIGVGVEISKPFTTKYVEAAETNADSESSFSFDKLSNTTDYTPVQYVPDMTTTEVQQKVEPSMVYIESLIPTANIFMGVGESQASGSGIIYKKTDDKYYIVTNAHVIEGATKITVAFKGGQVVEAKLTGDDTQKDLAVLEVPISSMSDETKKAIAVAEFGDSDEVQVGETAIAIGSPLGSEFENSVTQGIISALNRQIPTYDENLKVIQTDAAINSGNSGGALLNSKGQVIGINSAKIKESGVEGMGFAIPSNTAVPVFEDLIQNGSRKLPYLGIKGSNLTQDLGSIYELPVGVYVVESVENGPAAKAGIIATDIITDFNNQKIFSMDQLSELIKELNVGDTVDIRIIRNGDTPINLSVTLEAAE